MREISLYGKVKKDQVLFLVSVVFFRVLLDFVYTFCLHPMYYDSFLSFNVDFEVRRYIFSWLLFVPCLFLIDYKFRRYNDFIFLYAVLVLVTPLTSVYGLDVGKSFIPVVVTIVSILIIYAIAHVNVVISKKIVIVPHGITIIVLLFSLSIVYLVFWGIMSGAITNFNLKFNKVYEFRSANSVMLDVGYLAYLNIWTYKFFTIFLLVFALFKKKYLYVLPIIAVQVYFYGITAHKAVLFYPFLPIVIWLMFRKNDKLILLPLFFSFIAFSSFLIYVVFGYGLPAAMFVRRFFYVPARLTFEWFSFFSKNPHTYWSDRVLSFIFEYPYDLSIPHVVGKYLLSAELGANNGFISSGYAHAGFCGVFIYTVLFGMIIKFINTVGKKGTIPLWFLAAITLGPVEAALTSSDLLTVVLSHGLFMVLISFFFINRVGRSIVYV